MIRARCAPRFPKPSNISPDLRRLSGIKAVLFDFGGTLFSAAPLPAGGDERKKIFSAALGQALNAACLELQSVSPAAVFTKIEGAIREGRLHNGAFDPSIEVDYVQVFERVLGELAAERILNGHISRRAAELLVADWAYRRTPVWPMPQLEETLAQLSRRGIRLGIVSNAQFYCEPAFHALCGKSAAEFGLDPALLVWSYRLGVSKPHPQIFQCALTALREKYGISAGETLYVGNDMLLDIAAASRAGMHTALFVGDAENLTLHEHNPLVAGIVPGRILSELSQLLQVVL